eukprot:6251002-Amphidinium_carterae.3
MSSATGFRGMKQGLRNVCPSTVSTCLKENEAMQACDCARLTPGGLESVVIGKIMVNHTLTRGFEYKNCTNRPVWR